MADLDVSSASTSCPSSSGDEDNPDAAKIREAIAPEFDNIFRQVTASNSSDTRTFPEVTDMELCRNGVDISSPEKPPSVRERWSHSRQAPDVDPLIVTRGFQDHVALRLGTIIDRYVFL